MVMSEKLCLVMVPTSTRRMQRGAEGHPHHPRRARPEMSLVDMCAKLDLHSQVDEASAVDAFDRAAILSIPHDPSLFHIFWCSCRDQISDPDAKVAVSTRADTSLTSKVEWHEGLESLSPMQSNK